MGSNSWRGERPIPVYRYHGRLRSVRPLRDRPVQGEVRRDIQPVSSTALGQPSPDRPEPVSRNFVSPGGASLGGSVRTEVSDKVALNRSPRKRQGSVTPVLRRAVLLRLSPPPTGRQADALLEHLAADWEMARERYRSVVAKSAGIGLDNLAFDGHDEVRRRLEGKTRVIDFPRLRSHGGSAQVFDTRISMAICTEEDEMSSKVWSRVGLPLKGSAFPPGIGLENLEDLTRFFRRSAEETSNWATKYLRRVLKLLFPHLQVRRRGQLEISALGVRDKLLAPFFERLAQSDTSAMELLRDDDAEARFSRYFRRATDLPVKHLQDMTAKDPNSFWFSSPVAVELDDGQLGLRQVLYFLRPTNDAVQALGLAFDDSATGDLAQRSAVKVSRWIANRV